LLDRIDLHIEVEPVPFEELAKKVLGENSATIRKRVTAARAIQQMRFEEFTSIHYNAQMSPKQLRQYCKLDPSALGLLKNSDEETGLICSRL